GEIAGRISPGPADLQLGSLTDGPDSRLRRRYRARPFFRYCRQAGRRSISGRPPLCLAVPISSKPRAYGPPLSSLRGTLAEGGGGGRRSRQKIQRAGFYRLASALADRLV